MLFIVRHGRTAHNASGLLLGRIDPPLDELGRVQAVALAGAIGHVDRVITSPLLRTQETAAAFGVEPIIDERWIELDYGDFDGRPLGEIHAETWNQWRTDLDFRPPNGESLRQLGVRVRSALDDLIADGSAAPLGPWRALVRSPSREWKWAMAAASSSNGVALRSS